MLRFLRVVLFWSHGAFVQGFWSKRVADTEEDKDALRLTRRASRAAREFFFGVVSIGICWCWFFFGKATVKQNDVCNDMTILHDNTWWIVMQCDEIWNMMWCHVMGLKMIWYDVRSVHRVRCEAGKLQIYTIYYNVVFLAHSCSPPQYYDRDIWFSGTTSALETYISQETRDSPAVVNAMLQDTHRAWRVFMQNLCLSSTSDFFRWLNLFFLLKIVWFSVV